MNKEDCPKQLKMATQTTKLALNWTYNPTKKEFKQMTTPRKGVQVYSIRVGRKNPDLMFFNHTDYSVSTEECIQYTSHTGIDIHFMYEGLAYVLSVPTGSKLAACRLENKENSNLQGNVGTIKRNPSS